ncbi:MAG: sodium:proton antiporter [Clostridiales bacterium]|nr:sodium:proton antiporter [Clostridiales bacterium]
MQVTQAYELLWTSALVVMVLLTLACLIRAIIGPRIADRIVSINMISTLTLGMIAVLALVLREGYLADVALIYSLLGFLAVVVLCKVFMGIALERKEKEQEAKKDA